MTDTTPSPAPQARDASVQTGCAANVTAAHDVDLTTSVAGIVNAQGDASMNQSGACAVIAQGDVSVTQSGAAAIVTQSLSGQDFGGGVVVSNDVAISKGWVGVALTPKMELSEDSRVIIGPTAAAIIVVGMFGLFGLIAVLGVMAAKRAAQWRPTVPMPSWSWRKLGE